MNGTVINAENQLLIMLTQTMGSDKKQRVNSFHEGLFSDIKDRFYSDGEI